MASIATAWGTNIAIQAGLAHEKITDLIGLIKKAKKYKTLQRADTACDLLNNAVGLEIVGHPNGKVLPTVNVRDLAFEVLEYYRSKGLFIAKKSGKKYKVL